MKCKQAVARLAKAWAQVWRKRSMKKHQAMQNILLRRSESRVPGKPVWKRVVQSEKVAKKTRLIDDSRFAVNLPWHFLFK